MVWVGNDHWGEHLRILGLTKQSNVNPIGHKQILGDFQIIELCRDFHSLNEASHHNK